METKKITIKNVNQYLKKQENLGTLRFITCGSVDDGKSTLIGRMLFESQMIFEDQIEALKNVSKKFGTQGKTIDFSLLVDGLVAEREQGITIDVAYRFFSTDKRKFIVADTPGHDQYTRNMVTGASTAEVALILIDARKGILTQTKRHSMICSVLGVKKIVIVINKMDLIKYKQKVFNNISEQYELFSKNLNFLSKSFIPVSALKGDNIVKSSENMSWYKGPTLIEFLETIDTQILKTTYPLRFPVQWVNRPNQNFRGFSGTIEAGQARVGQTIKILPSGQTSKIKKIILFRDTFDSASVGKAVTITLEHEIDVSRGDIIVDSDRPSQISYQFEAKIIWLDDNPGYLGRTFWLKLASTEVNAHITSIKHKININTFENLSASELNLNELFLVTIKTDTPIAFEPYKDCAPLGGFILIDKISKNTVGVGMIEFALRRASNIQKQKFTINNLKRNQLNGHKSQILWFTGLSGSGKSTIANALEKKLYARGVRTYILDGDNVRRSLNSDLGFTDADRIENIRRIGEVAKLMFDAGTVVLVSLISPFRAERKMVRELFKKGEFKEIFVDISLATAEKRDPKGLYKKARDGKIPNFTGIGSPYEKPQKPDIHVKTEFNSVNEIVEKILKKLEI